MKIGKPVFARMAENDPDYISLGLPDRRAAESSRASRRRAAGRARARSIR